MKLLTRFAAFAAAIVISAAGCNRPPASGSSAGPGGTPPGSKPKSAAASPPASTVSDADLQKYKVNESGKVPILEYHNIRVVARMSDYDRSPADFRKDLDNLYKEGYRSISMHDYLDNHIDVPIGTTPVVLTFDDSSPTQFHYLADGSLDPNCAFGILKTFHEAHPDFGMKGMFYMNASPTDKAAPVFGDPATSEKKTKELLAAGMEVGNHTVTHAYLNRLSGSAVQKELADCVAGIHKLAPDAVVDTLALPFGLWPADRKLAEEGEAGGVKYHNRAILKVGSDPAPAPCSVKFKPLSLPRIQALPLKKPSGSEWWFAQMRLHPKMRYISDGDPATVTVPKTAAKNIDSAKLGTARLRTYEPAAAPPVSPGKG